MAERLNSFPENPNRRAQLDQFLDGSVWRLVQGSDYQGQTRSLVSTAREYARLKGGRLRTRKVDGDVEGVIVQFIRP